jgi:hypothetical protein
MSWLITPTFSFDADAQTYITAVETADGQALETATRYAINNFVIGCKQDGIWDAIKASCILAGARTLTGALVPLAGTAPTNFNFVDGDYNRKTGLVGDGSTKYLNANINHNATASQNNIHASAYVSTAATTGVAFLGARSLANIDTSIGNTTIANVPFRATTNNFTAVGPDTSSFTGLLGVSRSSGTSFTGRGNGSNTTFTKQSSAIDSTPFYVFARNIGSVNYSNPRLAFYSIGESLDLALLDARVTDLINAFDTAIPS